MEELVLIVNYENVDQAGVAIPSTKTYIFPEQTSLADCVAKIHSEFKWMNIALYPNQIRISIHIPTKVAELQAQVEEEKC